MRAKCYDCNRAVSNSNLVICSVCHNQVCFQCKKDHYQECGWIKQPNGKEDSQ